METNFIESMRQFKEFEELRNSESVNEIYEKFWKHLVEKDGVLDIALVKNELFDFYKLIDNASEVYCHVTGSMLSKPGYDASTVIGRADDYTDKLIKEHESYIKSDLKEFIDNY